MGTGTESGLVRGFLISCVRSCSYNYFLTIKFSYRRSSYLNFSRAVIDLTECILGTKFSTSSYYLINLVPS
eukprot:SAG31_NODE_32_length_32319_cov_28.042681_11_plen_71_part_00